MPQPTPSQVQQLMDRDLTIRSMPVLPKTANEADRSIEVVLTTDAPTQVFDWNRWDVVDEVLDMDGIQLPQRVTLLKNHDSRDIDAAIGTVREMKKDTTNGFGAIIGRVYFMQDDPDAGKAWNKYRDGVLTDFSIGYRVLNHTMIDPQKSAVINGKTYTANTRPLRVTTQWELKELSAVVIGADQFAKARSDASFAQGDSGGLSAAAITQQTEGECNMPEVEEKAPETRAETPATSPNAKEIADAARAETIKIINICRQFGASTELETKAINEGWDETKVRSEILTEVHAREFPQQPPGIDLRVGNDLGRDVLPTVLRNAICMSYGVKVDAKDAATASEFAGIGLRDLARLCIGVESRDAKYLTNPHALYQRAISTGTFTALLGDSANKVLQAAYAEYPSTASIWTGKRTVSDFKDATEIGLSGFSGMERLGTGEKFAHGSISEKSETYSADTYGLMFGISRKMMINDDLGGFMRVPQRLGVVARRNIDDVFYDALISNSGVGPTMNEDSQALFYASRTTANYLTGSSYDFDSAGLSALKLKMRKIAGIEGQVLNLTPKFLIVPPELEETARLLMTADSLFASGLASTSAKTIELNKNIHSMNALQIVVEPRLSAATNGTTAFYLATDPGVQDHGVIVYLAGNETPTIESVNPSDELGFAWRVWHDVGAGFVDWRGIARSAGA